MPRRFLAAFSACGLAACGAEGAVWRAEPVTTHLEEPVTVPLVARNLPLIEVEVDGHAARFLVDFGAETTLLDRGFVERAGLELVPLANRVTTSKGEEVVRVMEHFARVGTLSIGAARAEGLAPLVFDMSHLELNLDGILGVDVVGQWMVVFDDAAAELMLLPSGELATALSGTYAPGSEFSCLDWVDPGPCPRIALEFENGVAFDALLDTGAVHCSFPSAAVAELGLEQVGTRESRHVGGASAYPVFRVSRLSFETVTFKDFEVDAEERDDGLIGYSLLRRCVFVLDGPARLFCFAFEPERVR